MRALSENKNQMAAGMNPMNSMGQPGGLMGAAAGQGKEQKQIIFLGFISSLSTMLAKYTF